MEPTQALNFNIPKLKRQVTKDNLFEIDINSRDAKELLDNVSRTYLDQKYNCPWKVKNIQMVRNTELEQEYKAKRTDMKEEGRHSRELVDQIAFCAIKEPSYITKIAKNGMMTKNLPFSILGEHKSGVYLTKHADVQLKMVETISSQTTTALFVFNAILGKCKAVNERLLHSAEPTPNYDCHIPLQPAQPSDPHIIQLQRSQIYLYEYDDEGMPTNRPRQCLPHAVITYEKIDNFTVGPLKSIYCYDPNKNKKGEDKPDWKKTPRNMSIPQLPFAKNPTVDNQIRPPPAFGSVGWPGATPPMSGGPALGIPFNPDAPPHDLEPSNLLPNYAPQIGGVDAQGVVVHRSGSDPRKRFQQNIDELPGVSEQQRNLPPQQSQNFPNFRPGYSGNLDYQYSNDGQKIDNMTGWEPKAPHGFYSECEPMDNSSSPWHQSGPYNNNFNNNNNNFSNNNSNNVGNNRYGPSWLDSGPSNFEKDDPKRLKPGNTNCDNKSTNSTNNKSLVTSSAAKKSIPFALKKKKPTPSTSAASSPKTQEKDEQKEKTKDSTPAEKTKDSTPAEKTKDSTPAESDAKSKPTTVNKKKVVNSATKKKVANSTDSASKPKSQGKVQETAAKNIPFPRKSLVSEESSKSQPNLQDSHVQDLFTKLLQAESKDCIDTLSLSGKSSEKGKSTKTSKLKGSAAGQLPEKAFAVNDIHESELKKLQELIKEKIKSSKDNEKKASKNNQPKIKTTLSSLKQGLKTTILLPTPGKNNEENGPKLETLTKLLNIVDSAVILKTQPEVATPMWEVNYLSFLKNVQKMELTPGQHHKWVRKKEPPPAEPPLLDKIPPPPPAAAEVSIDDVVNTKLMKELLLEQDFSESTSVSEADSLYLPPTERSKKRKANSMTTRRQAKKKAPFDMSSYRRRRKRQKMQRKAAAEFDTSSLASTTSSFGFGDYGQNLWESDFKDFDMENPLPPDNLVPYGKETKGQEPPLLSYGKELTSREPTLRDLGFNSWKDAVLSLKFQPVVALKDCVQQITSHLHQEGGSNMMEWIGSQKELLETLNLPPDHSHLFPSSGSKASNQGKSSLKTATTSKTSVKTKPSKINTMDYPSTNETISINSIKASVRSEINKIKKMSSKKNTSSGTVKKKITKPKAPPIEIPRIKAKLPEKSLNKPDTGFQLPSNTSKDVKKPISSSTTSSLSSLSLPSKSTLSGTNTLQSKSILGNANKTNPPKGIIKNVRSDSAIPKTSAVSPATFPPTDQSLKVDLLMEIISAPPTTTTTTSAFELEQKRIAEQKKAAEQKKQKISFQAYMEKHVKPKPVKSPPHEKNNIFEAFKDFIAPEKDLVTKPVSEPPLITSPTTAPLLEKLKPAIVLPPSVITSCPTVAPYLEKLKPALVMPPNTGAFTNSLFSPLSPPPPPPPPPIPRDPRLPSKLPLPFPKDPPLPKIIPTIPKPAKEDLKPILKDKPVKSSSISHKKPAPLQKTLTIPLEDPNDPSQIVDPRLCRKPAPSQPDFHPVKEPQTKPPPVNDPLLPRDPRLLRIYGEYQSDGAVSSKLGKTPTQDAPADIYNPMKLKSCLSEGVSDVIGKSKPLIKNNTWNLRAIYTGDDTPKPPRRPVSISEEHSLHKSTKRPKPGTPTEMLPVYAQKFFSKDVSKDSKPSTVPLENIKEETVKLESESVKSELSKPELVKTESLKLESQEASIDRRAWGFYREMSPKRSGSEDANSSDNFKPALLNEKSEDNSGSDMDIASESPQVLYFSNSDSDSNMIGEDLTKPLYIDMSASATPRRDSFESYKFSLKSPEHSFKKSDVATDPRKSAATEMPEKTEVFKNPLIPSEPASTQNMSMMFGANSNVGSTENAEEKLSPFNETVPPVDPEAKNTLNSSLFCAYQMEGKAELKDTSHIWMKSLSNLSKVQAVSNVHISDETLDVLRKVFKENIPAAAPKDFSQSTPFPTLFPPTKETNVKKSDKDLHKPGTLNKDYKLGGLDKDLFKSSSLDGGLFGTEDIQKGVFKSESVDINSVKSESSATRPGVIGNRFGNDEKLSKTTIAPQSQPGNSNPDKTDIPIINRKTEMYSPTHPTMDEMSEKPAVESVADPKSEQLTQGQAIPVLNLSRKKQPPKKSRSLSPTTTLPSSTQYLPTTSGWMAPQQAPPFWSNWQNLPPFNPIMTTSHPTPPIWPHPINVAPPTHMGNIPFPPPGYVNPDMASYQTSQPDVSKPSNLYDWFADKIHYKGEAVNENNAPKIKDPHVESVSKFLNMLSKPGSTDLPFTPSVPIQGTSSKLVSRFSSAETKNSPSNLANPQIPKSESFTELASINTNQDNSNSKADSEKSRSSSYSPTDKTSEIVSISASDPSMSPGHMDSMKSTEKGACFNLKRTISIDSSLSSESCSRFSKIDSLKKVEEKQSKPEVAATASPSSNDDSEDDVWQKKSAKKKESKSDLPGLKAERDPSHPEPSSSTPIIDSAAGQQDADTSFSENYDSATNEDSKRTKEESSEERNKSKSRTRSRSRSGRKKSSPSSDIPKSVQISTINSKSLKDIKLAQSNRELLRKLAEQFSEKKGKSDLQNLLESVKKIKKELASQSSDEKESVGKSGRKSSQSPRHRSEEKNSSSRSKKSEDKGWSEKLWKPVQPAGENLPTTAASISSTSSKSVNKQNSKRLSTESSTSEKPKKDISEELDDKVSRSSKEDRNCDSELEEGELPDEESQSSEEETVSEEYSKHRSSRRRSESGHRKRRQPERRHSSQGDRFHKRRKLKSRKEEEMSPEAYPLEGMDPYKRGPPQDRYGHDRMESYPRSRMDYHTIDNPTGHPGDRRDYHPMDNPDGHPDDRMDYQHDSSEDCSPDRTGFYPPNRSDNYKNGRPENFIRGKQKRFHGEGGRVRGKFAPYPHQKPGGHYREKSNNYSDDEFSDYGPDDERDRNPWGRSEGYPYGNPDDYGREKYMASHDPDDYVQDRDGLLYEKSDEYLPFKKGYSHNWLDRHPRDRRGGSYSPGREGGYPDGHFMGNDPPPREGRFLGNGSPPRDGHFMGNHSPPRQEGPLHQGMYPPDNWTTASHMREVKIEAKNNGNRGIGGSVSGGNLAAETLPNMELNEATISSGPVSYGNPQMQTGPLNLFDEDDPKMKLTFDTIDSYLKMFVQVGSREYKVLKSALGVPLETNFNSLSKTKRKKIRKKIQSQLQALQAPGIVNNEDRRLEPDSTYFPATERPSFQMEDFQNFSSFEGNPNSMEHLKSWLNQRPDEDQFLHSRSLSETRDDSEDEVNPPGGAADNPEVVAIADPEIRRAVRMVSWMEKSPGFGTPHQRIPQKLLLAEEKDNLFSFEGCFLILMRKIPRKAVERLATLREVLNFLTCELQAAQKANDLQKFHKLQATKNKLHERRKDVLEKFTGTINPQRLQTIKDAKDMYVDCLEYLKRRPDPLPNVDKEFVVKSIKAIQGHISMTKKFLDEQQASNNPVPPPLSSIGFCPDRQGPPPPPPHSAQDVGWSWFGPRNMDQPMPGCYNQQRNNGPF